jgi:protein TonB
MAKGIDLTAQRWLDLIFADRNKEYGAYVLREESGKRHLQSLLIVAIAGMALIFLPKIIKSVIPEPAATTEVTEVNMADLTTEIPEENQVKQIENVPPPPQLKETIQFTPPVIKKDEEVTNELISQQDLTENKADISVQTVDGVKEGGIDIADLREHTVMVQEDKPKVFDHVEQMPVFPGGDKAMLQWLTENIQYPVIAAEQGIQGRVIVRFVVGPDGSVGAAEVQRSLDPSCDREALRVVRKMPKWIPGKQNGQLVSVYYTLPVLFKLAN